MHMLCWKDLNSAELETVRVSQNPLTVITGSNSVCQRIEFIRDGKAPRP